MEPRMRDVANLFVSVIQWTFTEQSSVSDASALHPNRVRRTRCYCNCIVLLWIL